MARLIRFHRVQAEKCRDLARMTDELRRRLYELADDYDARAREMESLAAKLPAEKKLSPLSPPEKTGAQPLTLSIKDAARMLGLGRTAIYRLIGEQRLKTVKIGNRTLIKTESIERLVEQSLASDLDPMRPS